MLDQTERRRKWLLLQLFPSTHLSVDKLKSSDDTNFSSFDPFFLLVSSVLTKAETADVDNMIANVWGDILREVSIGKKKRLRIVLDESQQAAIWWQGHFQAVDGTTPRPVLRPLILSWQSLHLEKCAMILSGTGISRDVFEGATKSASLKSGTHDTVTTIGSFADKTQQRLYIAKYLWPGKRLDQLSEKDTHLLRRCWVFLRGR
jgi:hypothetical protein